MQLLVTTSFPTLTSFNSPHLGRLYQPRMVGGSMRRTAEHMVWAADNDAYNGVDHPEYERAYLKMLKYCQGVPGGMFVTAPDKLYDGETTLAMFEYWEPIIRSYGLPVALVGQNGIEQFEIPWHRMDALFIGGDNEWKEGPEARLLVAEALARGKHVHVGRVNGPIRIWYAYNVGAHTIDGSAFGRMPRKKIPGALRIFDELHRQSPNPSLVADHRYRPRWTKDELYEKLGFAA